MSLVLYSKPNCPKCVQLKQILTTKGILYSEVDLGDPIHLSEFKKSYPTVKSVPFVAGDFVHFR